MRQATRDRRLAAEPGPAPTGARAHVVTAAAPSRAPRRRRPGRPTLLDHRTRELLLSAIRAGNRLAVAARFAGISPKTFSEWLRRGRGLDGRSATRELIDLVEAVERAQAEAEVAAVAMIRKAMKTNWRAAAWYLENVAPEWRRRKDQRVDQPAAPSPPSPVGNVIVIDAETLQRLATERIRAERGEATLDEATLARRARLVSGT
ncbi:hypothetical protein BH23CHL8_BH23CHL8_27350 [soil metagenome]